MLMDSAHIQEMDAVWQTRKNKRKARSAIEPLYTEGDAIKSLELLSPIERDQVFEVEAGVKARLRNAGHILGSSILELWIERDKENIKIVFSGDLGKKDQLIVRDPHEVFDADYLFIESTYGNRLHRSFDDSKIELLQAIQHAASHGEKTVIPAFAVERTQEILYILGEFQRNGSLPDIPVYLDSPLAIKATEIFRKNKKYYDEEARAIVDQGFDPFSMPNLKFTASTRESMAINNQSGPCIVIAGNGMCTAGRIKHHLKHNIWREGASLVIIGFQAMGTTGRKIVDGAKHVKIFREDVAVRAKVFTIGGFSAHADQNDLLGWVGCFESKPKVFVVHGETAASEALSNKINDHFGFEVHVPQWKEQLILKPREMKFEMPAEVEPGPDLEATMQNTIVDLENEIDALKRRLKKAAAEQSLNEAEIDKLEYIREEFSEILST